MPPDIFKLAVNNFGHSKKIMLLLLLFVIGKVSTMDIYRRSFRGIALLKYL